MLLRLTVDDAANVVDVQALLNAIPFPGYCDTIGPAYQKMIGLNLLKGFRSGLKERLSGTEGCTHLNELAAILPTVAIQTFSFNDLAKRSDPGGKDSAVKPFELDQCHALTTDSVAVERYYPRWFVKKQD